MYEITNDWQVIESPQGEYKTQEEARKEMIKMYAQREDISYDLAYLIFKKRDKINRLTLEIQEMKADFDSNREAMKEEKAQDYVGLIPKVEGETYKETSDRLSQAIGRGIDKDVFHKAVKLIRTKTI